MTSCLIFGAGPGLGQALASRFCQEGNNVFLVARNRERLAQQVADLEGQGGTAEAYCCDLADRDQLDQLCKGILDRHGAPDILVYNAFRRLGGEAPTFDLQETESMFEINVWAAVRAIQAFYPAMKARGSGTLLVTGGGAAIDLWPDLVPLGMSKAALRNFCLNLAETAREDGIHAATVTICGHIRTGSKYDPVDIAETFLSLHQQKPDFWQNEYIFK